MTYLLLSLRSKYIPISKDPRPAYTERADGIEITRYAHLRNTIMFTFGLGRLVWVIILLVNSVAILNEERFIRRLFGSDQPVYGEQEDSMKSRTLNLVRSVRTVMRPFLIAMNLFIIFYELIAG